MLNRSPRPPCRDWRARESLTRGALRKRSRNSKWIPIKSIPRSHNQPVRGSGGCDLAAGAGVHRNNLHASVLLLAEPDFAIADHRSLVIAEQTLGRLLRD